MSYHEKNLIITDLALELLDYAYSSSHFRNKLFTVTCSHCVLSCVCITYSSPNIVRVIKSRRMRWAGHVAHMEEGRGVYKVLLGKPEGKRPLGRPRHRWEDNIKMDLQEFGRDCGDWMELVQDRDR